MLSSASSRHSRSIAPGIRMWVRRWSILASVMVVAILVSFSTSSAQSSTPVTTQTITITTPASGPYIFTGMPSKLKAGTYKFKYINESTIPHNFKIRGAGGFHSTKVCAKCTKTLTVTLSRFVNGGLSPKRMYFCEPHKSKMHGTVLIAPAT